jgi:hypothetical protein
VEIWILDHQNWKSQKVQIVDARISEMSTNWMGFGHSISGLVNTPFDFWIGFGASKQIRNIFSPKYYGPILYWTSLVFRLHQYCLDFVFRYPCVASLPLNGLLFRCHSAEEFALKQISIQCEIATVSRFSCHSNKWVMKHVKRRHWKKTYNVTLEKSTYLNLNTFNRKY